MRLPPVANHPAGDLLRSAGQMRASPSTVCNRNSGAIVRELFGWRDNACHDRERTPMSFSDSDWTRYPPLRPRIPSSQRRVLILAIAIAVSCTALAVAVYGIEQLLDLATAQHARPPEGGFVGLVGTGQRAGVGQGRLGASGMAAGLDDDDGLGTGRAARGR